MGLKLVRPAPEYAGQVMQYREQITIVSMAVRALRRSPPSRNG